MKAFIATLFLLLVASNAASLRFLKSTTTPIIPTLKKCQNDDIDACMTIISKNVGGSDNAHCGSLPTQVDAKWTETRFNEFCQIKESCFKKSEGDAKGTVVLAVTEDNYLTTIELLKKISEPATVNKIGDGVRRQMMNPGKYGAWACQSWAQLSDSYSKSIFNADGFVYDKEGKACKLIIESSDAAPALPTKTKKASGVSGLKSCNVREEDFKFEKLVRTSSLLTTCRKDPKAKECKKVDNMNHFSDPAYCSVLGSDPKETDCVVSDGVAKKCFNEAKQVNLPAKRVTTGSDAAAIQSFLLSLEGGEAIALKVGFTLDGNVEYLGARPKMLIPSIAGEVACRNLLQMTDNYGAPIMDAKKYDMFFYDSAKETCSFFLEDDYNKAQEETEDGRYIEGPAFC